MIQSISREEVGEEVWTKVKSLLTEALKQCDDFRRDEGKVLGSMLADCCEVIGQSLEEVKMLDPKRVARVR